MIDTQFAQNFAEEWIAAWNAHDVERVLRHYTEDFTIETPVAIRVLPGNDGRVSGKEQVRAYWNKALEMIPDLHFDLLDLLTGMEGITLYYTNMATGKRSAEQLHFNGQQLVDRVVVHYTV
ncbi:nuclear transport factor 2 family protein [Taibaiella chishuiensis]|uniref:SnoaL-like protein n=1 Tax=Taibaiella chishuiensis TaxID=1434707 RepID=A0A2P8CXB0_9BACT|nr:nuclear transport factor 2 family protein [Taibaiella chishuiensis]PSK89590.1 SnoaL-like protein [Taibaiella chishuiensis]